MTRRGHKVVLDGDGDDLAAAHNQDRAIIVAPFARLGVDVVVVDVGTATDEVPDASSSSFLMGLWDGHGTRGHVVAEHARARLPVATAERLAEIVLSAAAAADEGGLLLALASRERVDDAVARALTEAFVETDRDAPSEAAYESGCTSSVTLYLGGGGGGGLGGVDTLYVANAGDSRTLVASYASSAASDTARVVYASRPDKPHLPEERERIERAGGVVRLPIPLVDETSRVVVGGENANENADEDVWGLAMSRSIGDARASTVGVVAEPIVDAVRLEKRTNVDEKQKKKEDEDEVFFVVTASDGLFDVVAPSTVVQALAEALDDGNLETACEELVVRASEEWSARAEGGYRDDITIAVRRV